MNPQIEQEIALTTGRLVALYLWHLEAIKVNAEKPFQLTSGNYSPIYINCRVLISSVAFMDLFAAASRQLLGQTSVEFDVIAGGETAGIPFAAFLARAFGKPMVYVRKAAQEHGMASRVEGQLESASRVLLVEDLITDAGSKLSFIDGIKQEGGRIEDVVVVFDRLQGGREALGEIGISLHALTNTDVTLAVGVERELITFEQLNAIKAYLGSARTWHEQRGLPFHEPT